MPYKYLLLLIVSLFLSSFGNSQPTTISGQTYQGHVISTAVPFLRISPDARAGAMGDVGVATSPDNNSTYWNIGKLALVEKDLGFTLSYTPWLAKIVPDMSVNYLSGYYKINKEQAIAFTINYFDLGSVTYTNSSGLTIGNFDPKEYYLGGSYSRLLTKNMGIGLTIKYIHSNLLGSVIGGGTSVNDVHSGNSFAADLGWYYRVKIKENDKLAFGVAISDIGNKITYSADDAKEFIPTNLRLGSTFTHSMNFYHRISFSIDFNKLLVPSPPLYGVDSRGYTLLTKNGNPLIQQGKSPDRPLLSGMIGSFTDAPDGFIEEIKEVTVGFGIEYWYNNGFADIFSFRTGYFHEDQMKGNRKYLTFGTGLRYNSFGVDFAYIVPVISHHPLAQTLRFSLLFEFINKNGIESIKSESHS